MFFTDRQLEKINEDLGLIISYLRGMQPNLCGEINVTFGENDQYFLKMDKHRLFGNNSIVFKSKKEIERIWQEVSVYEKTDYAVSLIENWQQVKQSITAQIEKHNNTLKAIENFQI